jgi:hypothetical protein
MRHVWTVGYVIVMATISFHFYRLPDWNMDMLAYMGNALLLEDTNVSRLHQRVYAEVSRLPSGTQRMLMEGEEERKDRAAKPDHWAEFLPLFAIRPMYNASLYILYRLGVPLLSTLPLVSAGSYFGLSILIYCWLKSHETLPGFAAGCALLIMLMPPIVVLGRYTGADGISTFLALISLYLLFERSLTAVGVCILLSSIFFRTDNVVLAVPVLVAIWFQKRMKYWQAAVLGLVAIGSVLVINHAAGDYGIQMLYYRNFVAAPFAPAEMVVHFTPRQYAVAFLGGGRAFLSSYGSLFLLLAIIGLRMSQEARSVLLVVMAYAVLHYGVLPNWQDRWFGVFYLVVAIASANALSMKRELRPISSAGTD